MKPRQRLSKEAKQKRYWQYKTLIPSTALRDIVDDRYDPICNWPYNGRCLPFTMYDEPDDEHSWHLSWAKRFRELKLEYEYQEAMQRTHGRRMKGA